MPLGPARLVYAHVLNAAVVATGPCLPHVVVEHAPDALRPDLHQVGNRTGRHLKLQQRHDVGLEHQREAFVPPGPRYCHLPDIALAVHDSGDAGVEEAAVLEKVQVAPCVPLRVVGLARDTVVVNE